MTGVVRLGRESDGRRCAEAVVFLRRPLFVFLSLVVVWVPHLCCKLRMRERGRLNVERLMITAESRSSHRYEAVGRLLAATELGILFPCLASTVPSPGYPIRDVGKGYQESEREGATAATEA
jgi:hypothetical protein